MVSLPAESAPYNSDSVNLALQNRDGRVSPRFLLGPFISLFARVRARRRISPERKSRYVSSTVRESMPPRLCILLRSLCALCYVHVSQAARFKRDDFESRCSSCVYVCVSDNLKEMLFHTCTCLLRVQHVCVEAFIIALPSARSRQTAWRWRFRQRQLHMSITRILVCRSVHTGGPKIIYRHGALYRKIATET